MQTRSVTLVESFSLSAQPMTAYDIVKLHELSVSVGWMHRAQDWEMLLRVGQGIFVADEIGRAVAAAMWFALGERMAGIGMVITVPRLQEYGTGRWLMKQILEQIGDRNIALNATRAAYNLYCSLGFQPAQRVYQHNGFVGAVSEVAAGSGPAIAMTDAHRDAIHQLDMKAYTAPRTAILDEIVGCSQGTVMLNGAGISGYALSRRFGRGYVIGPVVAANEEDALALVAPHVRARRGDFVRLDTHQAQGPLRDFLDASGIRLHDTATSMFRGADRYNLTGPKVFGLASQALG